MTDTRIEYASLLGEEDDIFSPWLSNLVGGKYQISFGFYQSVNDLPTIYSGANIRQSSFLFTDPSIFNALTASETLYVTNFLKEIERSVNIQFLLASNVASSDLSFGGLNDGSGINLGAGK